MQSIQYTGLVFGHSICLKGFTYDTLNEIICRLRRSSSNGPELRVGTGGTIAGGITDRVPDGHRVRRQRIGIA